MPEPLGVRLRDDKVRSFAQAQLAAAQIKADKWQRKWRK